MRRATPDEIPLLVSLMDEMYAELGTPMEPAAAEQSFRELLADPQIGWVFLLESGNDVAGYMVVTFGFSMMFGGRDAFIDDLFVRPPFRDRRVGRRAVDELHAQLASNGVRAIHLLVADTNPRARSLYERLGFETLPHRMMTRHVGGS